MSECVNKDTKMTCAECVNKDTKMTSSNGTLIGNFEQFTRLI